jgi:hypothetical protein
MLLTVGATIPGRPACRTIENLAKVALARIH